MLATTMLLYANMNDAYITTTMVIAAALVDIATVTMVVGGTVKYMEET